ncbi:MAG TPA: hypothetical protein VLX59_11485 [Acidimicrobiales bacterium]|nr:hypothetical protein [Acidimicrobiales bacterium]
MSTTPCAAEPTTGADLLAAPRTFSPIGLRTVLGPLVWGSDELMAPLGAVVDDAGRVVVVGDDLCVLLLHPVATAAIIAAPNSRRLTRQAA